MIDQPPDCWNIFVRELAKILEAHDHVVGSLATKRIGFHTQKVDRLRKTCISETLLSALSPNDLEIIYREFEFTAEEKNTIRASLIALATERFLMKRIDHLLAYQAADEVFHSMERLLPISTNLGMAGVRGFGTLAASDSVFDEALDLIDEANLNLSMSQDAQEATIRLANAQKARDTFEQAQKLLESIPLDARTEAWTVWYEEIQQGSQQANTLQRT